MDDHPFGAGGRRPHSFRLALSLSEPAIDLDDPLGLGEGDLVDDAVDRGAVGGRIDRFFDLPMVVDLLENEKAVDVGDFQGGDVVGI